MQLVTLTVAKSRKSRQFYTTFRTAAEADWSCVGYFGYTNHFTCSYDVCFMHSKGKITWQKKRYYLFTLFGMFCHVFTWTLCSWCHSRKQVPSVYYVSIAVFCCCWYLYKEPSNDFQVYFWLSQVQKETKFAHSKTPMALFSPMGVC